MGALSGGIAALGIVHGFKNPSQAKIEDRVGSVVSIVCLIRLALTRKTFQNLLE